MIMLTDAITLAPKTAYIGTLNIYLGIISFNFEHILFPILYAFSLAQIIDNGYAGSPLIKISNFTSSFYLRNCQLTI